MIVSLGAQVVLALALAVSPALSRLQLWATVPTAVSVWQRRGFSFYLSQSIQLLYLTYRDYGDSRVATGYSGDG